MNVNKWIKLNKLNLTRINLNLIFTQNLIITWINNYLYNQIIDYITIIQKINFEK